MLIPQFLAWAEQASAEERADAAAGLARAFLYTELDALTHAEAERALTILLDDPSALVRRALAEAVATSIDVPRHLLLALVADQSDIAALVLERSPVLDDADLIDAVAVGDDQAQAAVARRPRVSAAVAGALAEVGGLHAARILCGNAGADLTRFAVDRLIARFGQDGAIREAIGGRSDLAAEIRHALVMATAEALSGFVTGCGWLSPERAARLVQDAGDRATIALAARDRSPADAAGQGFVAYLRRAGHLTPALLLRSLLSRDAGLFEAALCQLSGRGEAKVAGLVRSPSGLGFAALYKSAGLPPKLMPVFQAALAICRERGGQAGEPGRLDRHVVRRVIETCPMAACDDFGRLSSLLRRFDVEAARDDVRRVDAAVPVLVPAATAPPVLIEHQPDILVAA